MRRATLLALVLLLIAPAARTAETCPVPESAALQNLILPSVRLAVASGTLPVLVLGGAPMAGAAAGDPAATLPARLQAGLAAALPGVAVRVVNAAIPRATAESTLPRIPHLIRENGTKLVIWATGAREAALGSDVDDFADALQAGIAAVHKAGADLILMDMQYAPSIARITNNTPFRAALLSIAATHDVAVLARHEMMMHWNDSGLLDLDARDPQARQKIARQLFSCLSAALAGPIAAAAR